MSLKKHVGRIKNTDQRCVVVFHQIPNRETHALIVNTDSLPDSIHEVLMEAVNSAEGQEANDVADVLSRRYVSSTGTDILTSLHVSGRLTPYPIEQIVMYPYPNNPIPLSDIVMHMTKSADTPVEKPVEKPNFNRFKEDMDSRERDTKTELAQSLLRQASMLVADAQQKRIEAYNIAPWLNEDDVENPAVADASDIVFINDDGDNTVTNHDDEILQMIGETKQAFTPDFNNDYEDNTFNHDVTDKDVQSFLKEATKRQEQEQNELLAANQEKKPVGRPKKNVAGK